MNVYCILDTECLTYTSSYSWLKSLVFFFEMGSHLAQADPKFSMWLRMTLNSCSKGFLDQPLYPLFLKTEPQMGGLYAVHGAGGQTLAAQP